ncbi:Exonuclease-Endonuclease-Phosphatase [Megavirus chiliensis]|uniref:Exonuclease-Endonuclease-Phosphatase n=1 Tax=Megavirus chiliensis TaxID=1094892 RepID=G5CSH9_9VIRU|nr:putative endonuclease/exonuclease/phosphatase [Megavirus chiliensis]AEQ33003.1 Exonuclease-Endonuclease-Phosphatase [Megavirus chiliensis]
MKILNLNIFRGFHTQFHEIYNWQNRRKHIIDLIESTLPDIILFQECNRLKHSENLENFMKNFPNYNYNIQYSHPNILRSRALIIAYNPEKVFKITETTKWLSDTPDIPSIGWGLKGDDFGRIVYGCKFIEINNGNYKGDTFWIFNIHFDVDPIAIFKSIKLLPGLLNKIEPNGKIIIAGDFNTDDEDLFENFKNNGYDCLSNNYKTTDNVRLDFSFVGKRDDCGQFTECMYLDHVFGKNINNCNVYCPYNYEFIMQKYITSDHLPIIIESNNI